MYQLPRYFGSFLPEPKGAIVPPMKQGVWEALFNANIPLDVKGKIIFEYRKLQLKHPNWTRGKTMKKAGKLCGVKITFV